MLKSDAELAASRLRYRCGGSRLSFSAAVSRLVALALIFLLPTALFAQNSLSIERMYSPLGAVGSVVYSPDGKLAAVYGGGNGGTVTGSSIFPGWGANGNGVQIYDAATGALIKCLPTLAGLGGQIAFSPDGHLLAVGGGASSWFNWIPAGGVLELWNVSSGTLEYSFNTKLPCCIDAVAFSPDGSTLADAGADPLVKYSGGNIVEFWNVSNGKPSGTLATGAVRGVHSIAFAPRGNTLAIGGVASTGMQAVGIVELWNVSTGKLSETLGHDAVDICALAFSPDGSKLAYCGLSVNTNTTGNPQGVVDEWDVASGHPIFTQNTLAANPCCLAYSPDGQSIADGGVKPLPGTSRWNGLLETRSAIAGTVTATFPTPYLALSINSVAFSPNGAELLDGGVDGFGGIDYYNPVPSGFAELEIWSVATQVAVATIDAATNFAQSVAILPDGVSVAVGGDCVNPDTYVNAPTLGLQNIFTGLPTQSFSTTSDQIVKVALSPDGTMLADIGTKAYNGSIEVWNVSTGALIGRFKSAAAFLNAVTFSPDGKTVADGGYSNPLPGKVAGVVEMWNIATGGLATLPTAAASVTSLAFSPDGRTLADGGWPSNGTSTGNLEVWNVATGLVTELPTTSGVVMAVAFSPDGSTLVDAGLPDVGSSTLETWNLANLTVTPAGPLAAAYDFVYGMQFTSNGKALLACTSTGLEAFNVPGYSPLASCPQYNVGGVGSVSVSPDQSTLVLAAGAGQIVTAANPLFGSVGVAGLSISSSSVTAGTDPVGTVTLAKSAPRGGNIVSLSSGSIAASVPPFVTVPAGAKKASFTISTRGVPASTTAVITAASSGVKAKASLTVNPASLTSLAVSPSSVVCGKSSVGTVTLNGFAPPGGALVELSSSDASAVVPQRVRVAAGTASATFTVKTLPGAAPTKALITAKWGSEAETATLTITPASVSALTLCRSSVVGGSTTAVAGTVTLTGPAPAGGYNVVLASSDSSEVKVSASVTVAAGASTATFTVTHYVVSSPRTVAITASFAGSSGKAVLTLDPLDVTALSITPASVTGGANATGTVSLALPVWEAVTVKLTHDSVAISVPASVTIPANASTATFAITTKPVSASVTAHVLAILGSSAKEATLTVKP